MVEDASELSAIGVFSGLHARALQDCAQRAVRRRAVKGEAIFHQGDGPARFHALLAGWVRVLQAGRDGEMSVIRFVAEGEVFGSFAVFAGGSYPADAIAASDCVELSWSEAHLRELIDDYPSIAMNLVSIAAHRLAELQERLREISTQPAQQRIANALLRLARKGGRADGDGALEIVLPMVRNDVAAMSATTLYTASRTMCAWERRGLLASSGRRISITSPAELSRIAEGDR